MIAKPSRREILAGVAAAAVATALPVIPLLAEAAPSSSGCWWDDAEQEGWRAAFAEKPLVRPEGDWWDDAMVEGFKKGWDRHVLGKVENDQVC